MATTRTGRGGGTGAGSPDRGYTAQILVRLSPDTKAVLAGIADARGMYLSDAVREAIEGYIAQHRGSATAAPSA